MTDPHLLLTLAPAAPGPRGAVAWLAALREKKRATFPNFI